ncbi:MAG: DEAD/DEAH box helicase [Desulfatirhabdiaceae bacterium]
MTEHSDEFSGDFRADKPAFLTEKRFDQFELPESLQIGLTESGFTNCTPIQATTLPVSLAGRDVAGQAQTGTGKTAAFLVTVFTQLLTHPPKTRDLPTALIVAPTRELALQIYEEACRIGRHTGLIINHFIGGVDYQKQADALREGTDIVICTPGRIIDYHRQGIFKTQNIQIVVIDEADRLLDLGFEKDMRFILKKLPRYDQRQSMLFSATLSYRVLELTYEYMNLPEFIAVAPEKTTVDGIEQTLFHVGMDQKLPLLLGLLEKEEWTRVLVFVNTKTGVEWVARKLKGNGYPAEGISGDLLQRKRLKLMEQFKDGALKILVATDVASRGIHVEDITHVINYDLPQDPENYVHRIGRTARAGKTGKAISLACETYVFHLEQIEALLNAKIPVAWAQDDWFKEDKAGPIRIEREKRPPKKDGRPPRKKPARGKSVEYHAPSAPSFKFTIPRGKDYFPGAFFGFGPQSDIELETELDLDATNIFEAEPEKAAAVSDAVTALPETVPVRDVSTPAETATPSAPKKRRRRRKKKTPAPVGAGTTPENNDIPEAQVD